jgi:hypothetical protein
MGHLAIQIWEYSYKMEFWMILHGLCPKSAKKIVLYSIVSHTNRQLFTSQLAGWYFQPPDNKI